MTPLLFLGIAAAGGVGASLRFLLDGVMRARVPIAYPVGTTVINISGSLLLGLLAGLASAALLPEDLRLLLGTGLLGGYTTFSTASLDTVRLLQERRHLAGLANGLGMLAVSALAAGLGYWVGAAL